MKHFKIPYLACLILAAANDAPLHAYENLQTVMERDNLTFSEPQLIAEGKDYKIETSYIVEKPVEVKAQTPLVEKPHEEKPASDHEKSKDPNKKEPEKPKRKLKCENCATSDEDLTAGALEDLQTQVEELKDKISDLESSQDNLADEVEANANKPSEEFLARTNFLLVGTAYSFFTYPHNQNSTFGTVIDPVFLWRYGDRFLYEMKLDITLTDCTTDIQLIYGTIDYITTDWLTVRTGKFSTPLGLVWEKMTTGWINKLPNLPLPYFPRTFAITPAADVGLDLRGAVPAGYWFGWGCENDIPVVIVYDFWIGNGPGEVDGDIALDCAFDDNNYNKSLGSRIALRPQPFREIGFSGTRAQWNNNRHAKPVTSRKHLYYNAFVVDLNWGLTQNSKVMGEYIWTEHDVRKKHHHCHVTKGVYQTGWWLQYSTFLGNLAETFFFVCKDDPIWNRLEFVSRYSAVDSTLKGVSRQQFSLGLNYFIENTLVLKGSYDFNNGRLINGNRVTIQLACAY